MQNITSLAEHADALLYLFGISTVVVAFFLRSTYRSLALKLDRMEGCLMEVKKGYVRKDDLEICQSKCVQNRAGCQGYSKECTDRILRVLERLEKGLDRNHSSILFLTNTLVSKGTLTGEDFTKVQDKMDVGK